MTWSYWCVWCAWQKCESNNWIEHTRLFVQLFTVHYRRKHNDDFTMHCPLVGCLIWFILQTQTQTVTTSLAACFIHNKQWLNPDGHHSLSFDWPCILSCMPKRSLCYFSFTEFKLSIVWRNQINRSAPCDWLRNSGTARSHWHAAYSLAQKRFHRTI